jgi:hypothetical protein
VNVVRVWERGTSECWVNEVNMAERVQRVSKRERSEREGSRRRREHMRSRKKGASLFTMIPLERWNVEREFTDSSKRIKTYNISSFIRASIR